MEGYEGRRLVERYEAARLLSRPNAILIFTMDNLQGFKQLCNELGNGCWSSCHSGVDIV